MDTSYNTNIFEIAKWFLNKESMSHKKLQKLCYYALSWYYALYNAELVHDFEFEAWVHGPVSSDLYQIYRIYKLDIPKSSEPPKFDKDLNNYLNRVYERYGHMDGDELEELTHSEEPWKKARGNLPKNVSSKNKLDKTCIKEYYKKTVNKLEGKN
ncbi:putative phage-associated protein [Methanococcus maripaludis]|uniref:Putative phage-associated protein n=1 Tax=Methanococcus maripaludis TaxID=39152 RepID=A0A7J9S6Q9_METMI|nr:type II toxin-antitoxin system antitoxin SocA domain-containing protein [Methanococcus maripaludis]MBB6402472.1 putative phage-associated protein [Methanococcus maripaludis]